MSKKKFQWEIVIGSWAREVVRSGFTCFGIYAYFKWGQVQTSPCTDSKLAQWGVNANQVFAVIVIFVLGNGVGVVMKLIEVWRHRNVPSAPSAPER